MAVPRGLRTLMMNSLFAPIQARPYLPRLMRRGDAARSVRQKRARATIEADVELPEGDQSADDAEME